MDNFSYNRQNNNLREKLRRKRKRRKIFFSGLGIIVVLGAGGLFLKGTLWPRIMDFQESFVKSPEPDKEQVETPVLGEGSEIGKGLPEVKEFTSIGKEEKISTEKAVPGEKDLSRMKEGYNHSYEASAYAYDTADVKAWMKGTKEFDGEKKLAFLTFDDGPNKNTEKVLDILKRRNVPGTFFLLGSTVDKNGSEEIFERYIKEGHGIAIHTYSHDYGYLYPGRTARPERVLEEYEKAHEAIRRFLGESFNTRVFRFPGGAMSWKNIEEAQNALLTQDVVDIDWNSLSGDSEPANRRPANAAAMGRYAMQTFRYNGDRKVAVVLMHDVQNSTPEYLDLLIDEFEAEGFTFGILK